MTESAVLLVRQQQRALLASVAANAHTRYEADERWAEAIRRCNRWPLSLRDACWTVALEMLEGRPTCWLR